jgi:hypothetical protein
MAMRRLAIPATFLCLILTPPARAYIEAPHTLGKCVHESTNIVLLELVRVNTEKNLLIYKKVADLKGKHPGEEIKHNIGKRGFHEREWKNIMAWAEVGKKAVFMYNQEASETCIGTYWYQCYREGDWWGLAHAEPFLLRTFYGDPEKLADHIVHIVKGEEVIVPCLADGNKEQLHQRKGKLQRMKASLKKLDYDPKKDFAGWGGDGEVVEEFKTVEILSASTADWRFIPAKSAGNIGERWTKADFDDKAWRQGKAPIGYGEDEIPKRKGTVIAEQGQDFLFRRIVEVPIELLSQKGVTLHINAASDDSAVVYLNGTVVDKDPVDDHEFAYWNREIDVPLKQFKPGQNLIAVRVKNRQGSSDLYMDLELTAQIPLPKKPTKAVAATTTATGKPATKVQPLIPDEPRDPDALKVDRKTKTITVTCAVAPRKLPNLDQRYPIEVIATYPAPRGQKAHETVVVFKGIRPSEIHKAISELGLKPGKPAYGEGAKAEGPEVKLFLEITKQDGKPERIPFEKTLVHLGNGKPMTELKWHFTGSILKQPDPERDERVYGADLTGTLISIFPVTDCTLFQSQLTMKDEPAYKLETNPDVLPKEATPVKLIIQVP